jgi:hypothetical protein
MLSLNIEIYKLYFSPDLQTTQTSENHQKTSESLYLPRKYIMLSLVIPSSSLLDQDPSRCIQPRDKLYSLQNLVKDIKSCLGNDSGIDSSAIDEDYLKSLLRKYASNPNDWFRYFYNDYSKNYTRNTIENINQKANIVSLSIHNFY